MQVRMNDVKFFTYSTGGDPKIWATGNVNGNYKGIPGPDPLTLKGSGLSAEFKVTGWESSQWAAQVNGNGSLKRTDIGGTVNTDFSGNAAGTYTGTQQGSFSGTASGVAE